MTGSVALDVVIGLVFIYLLYSLLASIIQEFLATSFSFRGKYLRKAIIRMLEDGHPESVDSFRKYFRAGFRMFKKEQNLEKLPMAEAFYSHPLIKYLAENDYKKNPAYLSSENFAKALSDLLQGADFNGKSSTDQPIAQPAELISKALASGKFTWSAKVENKTPLQKVPPVYQIEEVTINAETLFFLRSLWRDTNGDEGQFKIELGKWFEATMDRLTMWYKRFTQGLLFVIGLMIAIFFNVNTIDLSHQLSQDPDLRKALVAQAENYTKQHEKEIRELEEYQRLNSPRSLDSLEKVRLKSLTAIKYNADSLQKAAQMLLKEDMGTLSKTLSIGWSCNQKCGIKPTQKKDTLSILHDQLLILLDSIRFSHRNINLKNDTSKEDILKDFISATQSYIQFKERLEFDQGIGITSIDSAFTKRLTDLQKDEATKSSKTLKHAKELLYSHQRAPKVVPENLNRTDSSWTCKYLNWCDSIPETNNLSKAEYGVCISCNVNPLSPLGWLITALAISMGAPFWFDLLKKVLSLKNG